jgi:hypothetical protein
MQSDNRETNTQDCHSQSLRESVDKLMRDNDARRLLLRAAARNTRGCDPSHSSEDLVSEIVCSVLAGDIVRDERPLLDQLLAEIANRGRLLRHQREYATPLVSDDAVLSELVDPATEPPEVPPRNAVQILRTVRALAAGEPLVLRLIEIQLQHGRVRRRDALAAGFAPHQYRAASGRLAALCHAVAATQHEAAARGDGAVWLDGVDSGSVGTVSSSPNPEIRKCVSEGETVVFPTRNISQGKMRAEF